MRQVVVERRPVSPGPGDLDVADAGLGVEHDAGPGAGVADGHDRRRPRRSA